MTELILTVLLLVGAFAVRRASVHREARWRGGVLLDDRARALLRRRTREGRRSAARASDALFWLLLFYPGGVDALIASGLARGDWTLATTVFLLDLQAFAAVAIAMFGLQRWIARERPYATHPDEPPYEPNYPERFRSFFSGHSAAAFTSAALAWLHHLRIDQLGAAWHLVTSSLLLLAAIAVALLRVAADRHWLSDVMAGAIVGIACGWLVPVALHGVPGRILHAWPP